MDISEAPPADYSFLVSLFLELRGRGVSLSVADFDILKTWQEERVSPEFIVQVMTDYAEECKLKGKEFPRALLPVSRKVRTILLKIREV